MEVFTICVGFTVTRPVVVDEKTAFVTVVAKNLNEAKLIAAQMIGSGASVFAPGAVWGKNGFALTVEMVTSTTLIGVEI